MQKTRVALVVLAAGALAALAITASAAAAGGSHTQSVTQNFHGTQTTTRQRRGMVHIHRGGQVHRRR